jgi:hypothetical protein
MGAEMARRSPQRLLGYGRGVAGYTQVFDGGDRVLERREGVIGGMEG